MLEYSDFAVRLSDEAQQAFCALTDESRARVGSVMAMFGAWLHRCPDRIIVDGTSKVYRHVAPFVEIKYEVDEQKHELTVLHLVTPLRPRVLVFVSYSRRDKKFKEEFRKFVKNLERSGNVHFWDDGEIDAGDVWEQVILQAMASSKVAVLLVTQEFIASDFIQYKEVPTLLARRARNEMKVFWIPVSPSTVKRTPLDPLQALWDPDDPLLKKPRAARQEALVKISDQLDQECCRQDL